MRCAGLVSLLILAACATRPAAEVTMRSSFSAGGMVALPLATDFQDSVPAPPLHGNADLARDFLDLEFQMESGRRLSVLTRFEGPISVALAGAVPPSAPADLARVLARLQSEAGLDIRAARPGGQARIMIEFLPRQVLARAAPTAACFVVPNVHSFAQYRRNRSAAQTDWSRLTQRDQAAIFIPSDTSPQEVRDCFHEELAQAIGPLNDLYRLPDSVFNDDNFNSVLTPFDMLMLRIHYAPDLQSGMTESQVAALLPGILARLNPAGMGLPPTSGAVGPHQWTEAVEATFGKKGGKARIAAADRMLAIARAQGWDDARLGLALYASGRAQLAIDPQAAVQALTEARRIYAALPGADIHVAHVDMQLAAIALKTGQPDQAIGFADHAIAVAHQAQNASLTATLMLIKAQALEMAGQPAAAHALRLDAAPLARYGFGSDKQMRARMEEIASLAARNGA